MKTYPKIPHATLDGRNCIAFDKKDGSNLRFEYSRKTGWYKFGTRKRMFDRTDTTFGCAIDIFINKYGIKLEKIVKDNYKCDSFIAFGEFLGPNSFAGQHKQEDVKDVVLFDINVHKKGFIEPQRFVDLFKAVHIPDIIYQGPLTQEFFEKVRNDHYQLDEGVICKGGEKTHDIWMMKIKTLNYLEKLKTNFGQDWEQYWE